MGQMQMQMPTQMPMQMQLQRGSNGGMSGSGGGMALQDITQTSNANANELRSSTDIMGMFKGNARDSIPLAHGVMNVNMGNGNGTKTNTNTMNKPPPAQNQQNVGPVTIDPFAG